MVGLLILKHVRNISDESIVEQWRENAYYQYFCGMAQFSVKSPCEASALVHFRHRIGESSIELIFKGSIRVNDEKLDRHKSYSLHEPDVACIAKEKDRVKYEFGNKVSIVRTWGGLIIRAKSFRNEYDGHTIDTALEQVSRLYPHPIMVCTRDRGYRGQRQSGNALIEIPQTPSPTDSAYRKRKKHMHFCKRAGIEPIIGHVKSAHRLNRNFYKGLFGDSINIMFAAAAFNFNRAMRALFLPF